MKKWVGAIVVCAFLLGTATIGLAAGKPVSLPDLDMSLEIPQEDGMRIAMIGGEWNDAMLELIDALGMDRDEFEDYLLETGTYLSVTDGDVTHEYNVMMMEDEQSHYIYDFDTLSQSDLDDFKSVMGQIDSPEFEEDVLESVEEKGLTAPDAASFDTVSIENINGITYLEMTGRVTMNGMDTWAGSYMTIKNGKMIYIKRVNYDGPLTDSERAALKEMVESADYKDIPSPAITFAQAQEMKTWLKIIIPVVIAAVLVLVFALRSRARKKAQAAPAAGAYPVPPPQGGNVPPPQGGNVPPQGQPYVQPAIQQPPAPVQASAPQPAPDKEETIKKLQNLRDGGVLTQEEFEAKVRELDERGRGEE